MYKVIPFGYRCSSTSLLKELNIKTESYPFDWIVSTLDVIQDCIETKFVHFLDLKNYITKHTETYHMIDNKKYYICNEVAQINAFYEKTEITENNKSTYSYNLALSHHNLNNDTEYFKRCISRLYDLFDTDIQKYYIHINPIMGFNDYQNKNETILNEFDIFNKYIIQKTQNIFGIYFILIKHNSDIPSIKIKETSNYIIFIIYCNDDFLDGGNPFMGNNNAEKTEVLSILQQILGNTQSVNDI